MNNLILPHPSKKAKGESPQTYHRLVDAILPLSHATKWEDARHEWYLVQVYRAVGECICGHPITDHCHIANTYSGAHAVVGCVCVETVLGIPASRLFAGIDRITGDRHASPSEDLVALAAQRGWITSWEVGFCQSTWSKCGLSHKQLAIRRRINSRILAACEGGAA